VYPDIDSINRAGDVPTGTVLWASCSRNRGSIPSRARGFDLLRSDQTGSQTHICVELATARASPIGIPRDIYRGWTQIRTNVPYCLWGSSQ